MAKIYVSSTIADLSTERKAVIDWLVQARHQPVHSYLPDSESVRDSCLADIDGCDLYVLILGFRYGYQQIDENNPDGLSITHLEFRRDGNIPRVALLATNIPNIDLTDLLDDKRKPLIMAFREEVARVLRPAQFKDEATLIAALSAGVQAELDKLKPEGQSVAPDDPAVLAIIGKLTLEKQAADSDNQLLRERITALETQLADAVARTLTAAAQPDASTAAITAAEALGKGDSRPAEALLRNEETLAQQEALAAPDASEDAAARRRAAELAREQGALAFGRDVRIALAAYERAARHEPEDTWTHIYLGDLYMDFGDLAAARQSYQDARATAASRVATDATDDNARHDLAVCYERLGNISSVQGNLAAALSYYRERHAIGEKLAAGDAANSGWQRDLSVSNNKIGDVMVAQGDLAGALAAYRDSLAIAEKLAAGDAANSGWQRDLSVSHNKIGDVLVAQGDLAGALAAYRDDLAIAEKLAASDAANSGWQRDLSVSHSNIGNVLVAQGDLAGALAAYRDALAIAEKLAASDAANSGWQRDLSVSHNKIGDVLVAQGDLAGALAAYRDSLAIAEKLAARDAANVQWQIDLAVSYSKLGTQAALTPEEKRAYLKQGLAIQKRLQNEGRLPPNQNWITWFEEKLTEQDGAMDA
ncbi:MAG: DUF4062 domain-containing protein [Methylococcales bacterium]|nr:DUF4062 domain-containing protein [Methylococcales bacterium]